MDTLRSSRRSAYMKPQTIGKPSPQTYSNFSANFVSQRLLRSAVKSYIEKLHTKVTCESYIRKLHTKVTYKEEQTPKGLRKLQTILSGNAIEAF